MFIDNFINEKIPQLVYFCEALIKHAVHYTEMEKFIWDCFEEWGQLNVTDETPSSARERVFWHLIHELKLASLAELDDDLSLNVEIQSCTDFLNGNGSYPIHCIGWRPVDSF